VPIRRVLSPPDRKPKKLFPIDSDAGHRRLSLTTPGTAGNGRR